MEIENGGRRTKSNTDSKIGGREEEDRISVLPDCLILEILSRLPDTKSAIRTGTLSKRWKLVWTSVPTLIFEHNHEKHSWSDFVSFIDKTLAQSRQLKLKQFYLCTHGYNNRFESQINKWIHYAVRCNVEELSIKLWNLNGEARCQLDEHCLTSSCCTLLKLAFCTLNPTVAICWKNLKTFWIGYGKLDEDVIENILSGSPVLETLVLNNCYGFKLLNITSKSLKKLVFSGYVVPNQNYNDYDNAYDNDCVIKINAPNILSLTIEDCFFSISKVLLLNISSLVEATIDLFIVGFEFSKRNEVEEEIVEDFILNLHHVKEFKIGDRCALVLSRLKEKGFVFPTNIKLSFDWPAGESALA